MMLFKKRSYVDWQVFIKKDQQIRIHHWQQSLRAESLANALAQSP